MYDVIIIGAGVIGASIGRALSKFELKTLIIEKENDVSCGASKANSGIVHGGYDAKHGTNKGYFSRKGNRMFGQLNKELNFGYEECGSLVLAFSQDEMQSLEILMANGRLNGVEDLELISRDQVLEMEPHVSKDVVGALYCPSAGITSPYELTIALAENAVDNGVALKLEEEVVGIDKKDDGFIVKTRIAKVTNAYETKLVINCGGAKSDVVSKMVGVDDFRIIPRRGEYILLHKNQGTLVNRVLFQAPTEKGKGILVTKTVFGNLMIGPNAEAVEGPEEIGTSIEALRQIVADARKTTDAFDLKFTLKTFAGIRATSSKKDFIIEETKVKGFINVAGIESPGLTSSPAIADYVVELVKNCLGDLRLNESFDPYRKSIYEEVSADAPIVCRCEQINEQVIETALNRSIPIHSTDAIKRRTRAGMGPCQGNYCGPKVQAIIARHNQVPLDQVTTRGKGSSSLPYREKRDFWKALKYN
jgi:glycerol-3-phosphate dehydrogenase